MELADGLRFDIAKQGTTAQPNTQAAPADRESLINEVTSLIIEAVNLHHMNRAEIHAETPLGKGGLNLDSVDILEIVVSIEQRFKVKVQDAEAGKRVFSNIGGIADFIITSRG